MMPMLSACGRHAQSAAVASPEMSRCGFVAAAGLTLGAAALAGRRAFAQGSQHEVKMLNRGSDGEMMVFESAFLKIAPGDTVTFVATDKSHNSESILGVLPEGAEAWKGKLNQDISHTFEKEGIYGYKCMPHFPLGMVGLIQVGELGWEF